MSLTISLNYQLEPTIVHEAYTWNVTHNLNLMAKAVGIYDSLWNGSGTAGGLIEPLIAAIALLKSDPKCYAVHEHTWGTYPQFVSALELLLDACCTYPNAILEVSR